MGSHIGPTTSHTTARTHDLSFRAITAFFGHFGMEWDVRGVQGAEREELRRVVGLYKEHRGLIHSGRPVHADITDEAYQLHGVAAAEPAADGTTAALFAFVCARTSGAEQPGRMGLPGLHPDRTYRVEPIFPAPGDADYGHTFTQVQPPAWLADGADSQRPVPWRSGPADADAQPGTRGADQGHSALSSHNPRHVWPGGNFRRAIRVVARRLRPGRPPPGALAPGFRALA